MLDQDYLKKQRETLPLNLNESEYFQMLAWALHNTPGALEELNRRTREGIEHARAKGCKVSCSGFALEIKFKGNKLIANVKPATWKLPREVHSAVLFSDDGCRVYPREPGQMELGEKVVPLTGDDDEDCKALVKKAARA